MNPLRRATALVLAAAVAAVVLTAGPARAGVPLDQLRLQIDRVLKVLEDPELKKDGRAKDRRLAAAELSVELGDVDTVQAVIAQVGTPDARVRWLREAIGGDGSDDVAPVRALIADARATPDQDLAYKLLLAAGTRCWWAVDGDHPVREEVAAATPETDDPRAIAVLLGWLDRERTGTELATPAAPPNT